MAEYPLPKNALRRRLLAAVAAGILPAGAPVLAALKDTRTFSAARAGQPLQLPADHGPHPDFRTEWWYFTGWFEALNSALTEPVGIQLTFFRSAPNTETSNPVRMAPRQLLFAHAAIAQASKGHLLHEQVARRMGLADTELTQADADGAFHLKLAEWALQRDRTGLWQARLRGREFELSCSFKPSQPEWLQGEDGFSRKGPRPEQASHYITLPHLQSHARLKSRFHPAGLELKGLTWMDHEWSTSVLDERAAGWDWVGLHGKDGSSLMAFRIRPKTPGGGTQPAGDADLWQHACLRFADGRLKTYRSVRFEPLEHWTSPRTGTRYPVSLRLHLDDDIFELRPLLPDQELDSRLSTGTVYWEGAVRVLHTRQSGLPPSPATGTKPPRPDDPAEWGRGYLELTGYHKPMKL